MSEKEIIFKRKLETEFQNWFDNLKEEKALLIKGLRQVGKSTLIKEFAHQHFKNVVYIDFIKNEQIKVVFKGDFDVNRIIRELSSYDDSYRFVANQTVIIFDEVQECSAARASIKYFIEDGRFAIIESGSLLGIKGYNPNYKSIPVGFEHSLTMHPLDFEEFLYAKKVNKVTIEQIKKCFANKETVPEVINNRFKDLYREYLIVGGMPRVVKKYILSNSFSLAKQEQNDLLEEFKDDFGKHLNQNEDVIYNKHLLNNINKVFDSIPSQLAKENNKFAYAQIMKKGRSAVFDPAIQWLVEYGLIKKCYNLSQLSQPFSGNKIDNCFKLYPTDIGLLMAMLNKDSSINLISDKYGIYRGAIYEGLVADSMIKNNHNLYYYHKDSGLEIDFVTEYKGDVTLIEVKAKDGRTKSANVVLSDKEKYPNVHKLIRIKDANISENSKILTIPQYLTFLL
ncbi:MAG: AAA family ATPase [Bacilli bacterium]|nr:AAA family ATPase [Bacilli bacterium]